MAFTMRQYVQTDLAADRQVANTLAELIIGGSLASDDGQRGQDLNLRPLGYEHSAAAFNPLRQSPAAGGTLAFPGVARRETSGRRAS
jgi:hypothetical protein